jgi:hypothetical protein
VCFLVACTETASVNRYLDAGEQSPPRRLVLPLPADDGSGMAWRTLHGPRGAAVVVVGAARVKKENQAVVTP